MISIDKVRPPRLGQEIRCKGKPIGVVTNVEGELCWVRPYSGAPATLFIWRFKEALNSLHDWDGKPAEVKS